MVIVLMAPVGSKYSIKLSTNLLQATNFSKQFMSFKRIYMCMVKVIEYKVETQTIQCHLEGYSQE